MSIEVDHFDRVHENQRKRALQVNGAIDISFTVQCPDHD
jgi:hypothetical protein